MPVRNFAMMIALVIAAAGVTVGLAAWVGPIGAGFGLAVLCGAALVRLALR